MSAAQLAEHLEVSQRTVLRDIEALSSAGFPVYAVRGSKGGFELLQGFSTGLPGTAPRRDARRRQVPAAITASQRLQRARVRLTPRGRQIAALTGRPAGLRVRHSRSPASREGWTEAWISADSIDAAVMDILALGTEVEVIHPPELRNLIRDTALNVGRLYGDVTP